ncbi:magnesium/cobalt transporter CorA [Dysgonomonas sp. ZJ709]|uniref:magnesium/cobalt transporter CorA n=1 Tax=Dysgonomonas sp. ZJ709 TaxID=2709797 RepID=UPI0013EA64BD|nr:magnesium/cobalt transporter CorA [Dysgonomonas sp. ZJ709]
MAKRTLKKRRHKQSRESQFLSTPIYQGENDIPTQIELIQYDESEIDVKNIPPDTDIMNEIKLNKINWFKTVGVSDVTRINQICRGCGLHGFDIKDLLSDQDVVKAVVYDKVSFVLMPGFFFNTNGEFESFQIGFILGDNFVISFQESPMPVFDDVKKAFNDNHIPLRRNGADFLLYVLLNSVNSLYMNASIRIEDQLLDAEDQLIAQRNSLDIMNFLRARRMEYIKMKRSIVSFREEYSNLLRNSNKLIKDENIVYINDYDDKLRTVLSDLEACHELLVSLIDLHYSNSNMRMNEIMKRLTIVSTIFIPLTFLAGVWGMNFKFMPEIESPYGYVFAWITFIVVGFLAGYFLKKRNWF